MAHLARAHCSRRTSRCWADEHELAADHLDSAKKLLPDGSSVEDRSCLLIQGSFLAARTGEAAEAIDLANSALQLLAGHDDELDSGPGPLGTRGGLRGCRRHLLGQGRLHPGERADPAGLEALDAAARGLAARGSDRIRLGLRGPHAAVSAPPPGSVRGEPGIGELERRDRRSHLVGKEHRSPGGRHRAEVARSRSAATAASNTGLAASIVVSISALNSSWRGRKQTRDRGRATPRGAPRA